MAPTSPAPHMYRAWDWLTLFGLGLGYLISLPLGGGDAFWLLLVLFAPIRDPHGAASLRGLIPATWLAGNARWAVYIGLALLSPLLVFVYLFQVARQSGAAYAEMGGWFTSLRHLGMKATYRRLPPPVWPEGVERHDATIPDQPVIASSAAALSSGSPPSNTVAGSGSAAGDDGKASPQRRKTLIAVAGGLIGVCLLCSCVMAVTNHGSPTASATNGKNHGGAGAVHPTQPPHATTPAGPTATLQPTATLAPTDTAVPSATAIPPTPRPQPTTTPKPKPTATPVPKTLFITFTSVSACIGCSSHISVKSNTGAQLTVSVLYECSGHYATSKSLQYTLTANPYATWYWTPATSCSGYADAYVDGAWNGQSKEVSYRFYVG